MDDKDVWKFIKDNRNSGRYFHDIKMELISKGIFISLSRVEEIYESDFPIPIYPKQEFKYVPRINLRQSSRLKVIEYFGDKCCRCGFSDIRALQLDHVNGGGSKENKSIGNLKIYKNILNRIDKGEEIKDYQVLCANCNWIKRYENKELFKRD